MSAQLTILLWLALYFFFPVVDISGHRIIVPEFYTYVVFFMNLKRLRANPLVVPFFLYAVLFFMTVLFTSLMDGTLINNHDIFMIRNIVQLILVIFLFDSQFARLEKEMDRKQFEYFIFKCLAVLSLPAFMVILQRLNPFGFRDLVISLYKPAFFFLDASSFASFRYTSVFKDFYTEAVFFLTLIPLLFFFFLKNELNRSWRVILVVLMLLVYGAQFFVARTSLMFSPLLVATTLFFISGLSFAQALRNAILFLLLSFPLALIGAKLLLGGDLVNLEWALEGLAFWQSEPESMGQAGKAGFSSYSTMNEWMSNFFQYIKDNPRVLFVPHHDYNLTESANRYLYTDSFYGQEIYRYGIYGMVSYFLFLLFLIKNLWGKSRMAILFVVTYAVLNYKGGNVFFMDKNIYLYAFVFVLLLVYERRYLKKEGQV